MFALADIDHSGSISFEEFTLMFRRRAGPQITAAPKHHTTKLVTAAFCH